MEYTIVQLYTPIHHRRPVRGTSGGTGRIAPTPAAWSMARRVAWCASVPIWGILAIWIQTASGRIVCAPGKCESRAGLLS
jgi:hypothetical protein